MHHTTHCDSIRHSIQLRQKLKSTERQHLIGCRFPKSNISRAHITLVSTYLSVLESVYFYVRQT